MRSFEFTSLSIFNVFVCLQMCLNRQCQNVSVFGVHECSAKCSSRGVSTAPFISFHCCEDPLRSLSVSSRPPPRWLVYLISHSPPPPHTEAHFDGTMLIMPRLRWVGSHYNASQSITPRAERFNQLPIMASFMLGFKCYSSYAQPVVLVPKTASKSKNRSRRHPGQALGALTHGLTLSRGAWILDFFLNLWGGLV